MSQFDAHFDQATVCLAAIRDALCESELARCRAEDALAEAQARLLASDKELADMAERLASATRHEERCEELEEQLAALQPEIQDLSSIKARMQELEAENAEFKKVSRLVTLQNENNRLREELRAAQEASRKKKLSD